MTDYRKDFPLLSEIGEHTVDGREWIYIDNAATSQRPQCVIDAERDFYLKHNANPLRGNYPLSVEATELYENARKGVRDFIGAKRPGGCNGIGSVGKLMGEIGFGEALGFVDNLAQFSAAKTLGKPKYQFGYEEYQEKLDGERTNPGMIIVKILQR